jgi:hypothetical protein
MVDANVAEVGVHIADVSHFPFCSSGLTFPIGCIGCIGMPAWNVDLFPSQGSQHASTTAER